MNAQGRTAFHALHGKSIRGWLAAVITAHDRSAPQARPCALDEAWAGFECVPKSTILERGDTCAVDASQNPFWKDEPGMQFQLKERQNAACRWLDEHGVKR